MKFSELIGKRIFAYVRVSREVQDADRQRNMIKKWAATNGLVVAEWYEDTEGSNPRDQADDRTSFQRLVQLVETGIVDAIVVDAQDRFGTFGAWELGKYLSILITNGCSLWSVEDGCLTQDDDGTVIKAVVNAQTSLKEQKDKGWRALTKKIDDAKAGRYFGGYPPYGLDVVCVGPSGEQKWRVVWTGDFERLKIDTNGLETEYKGKNNMPARDEYDIPSYAPSIRTERMEFVNEMFRWYATEEISPSQIAARLNDAGVSSVFGEGWNKQKVKQTLMNPAYIGMPAYNKRSSGRFWEYVGGEMHPVKRTKGRAKAGRTRSQDDYIFPSKPVFAPIVPIELFNEVQHKLKKSSKEYKEKVPSPRSPRTASFWLRNILFCSGCSKPMRAWNANPDRPNPYRSYFCANYGTYGKQNPTGCRSNRVKAELLEQIVERYLGETHQKISELIGAKSELELDAFTHLESGLNSQRDQLQNLMRQRSRLIRRVEESESDFENRIAAALIKPEDLAEGGFVPVVSDGKIYDFLFEERKPTLEAELSKLDAEHTDLLDRSLNLPAEARIARQKVSERLLGLEQRIESLREDLHCVNNDISGIVEELQRRKVAIEEARAAIGEDSKFRRKSLLVKQVIVRVVCHFQDTEGKGNQPRTELVRVEICPKEGDIWSCYPNGIKPG